MRERKLNGEEVEEGFVGERDLQKVGDLRRAGGHNFVKQRKYSKDGGDRTRDKGNIREEGKKGKVGGETK